MNPMLSAVRTGSGRGWIEFRQIVTNGPDLFSYLFYPIAMVVVLFFMRNASFGATDLGLGTLALPSILGVNLAFNALIWMSQLLAIEREDGTLLRAKAVPNGMVGYLVGKIITVAGLSIATMLIVLIPGALLVDGLAVGTVGAWLMLVVVVLVGLMATLPVGAIFGSIFESPRGAAMMTFPVMGVIAISGIFYPITAIPGWLQFVAQVFPVYWLGLGMRSALLPDAAVSVELHESWRHWETFGVLGLWALVGLAVAPAILRRMARQESGSVVAQRREKAMYRAG